jgi:hypothetical protein
MHKNEISPKANENRKRAAPITDTFTNPSFPTHINPTFQSKVDAFRTVESQVKSSMVPPWECDNKLSIVLHEMVGPAGRLG